MIFSFFAVNTNYISSSVLKILMFSTHTMKYIWYLSKKKSKFSLSFIFIQATCNVSPTDKGGAEMQNHKILANQIILVPKYSPPSN